MDLILESLSFQENWKRYALAFLILLAGLVAKKIFDIFISKKLLAFTQKTRFKYDEEFLKAANPPLSAAFLVISLFLAAQSLGLPVEPVNIQKFTIEAFRVATVIIVVWAAFRFCDLFSQFLSDKISSKDQIVRLQFIPLIKRALRLFVLIIGTLLVIQNLGYSVGSLLAGLGIGGLAVALAAQESLSNFFGSIVLLTDRPFKVGDWIQTSEVEGIVEELGFRSTRIRTFDKTLTTIPNKVLASAVVQNYSQMPKRRVRQIIGITYDSKPKQVEDFVQGIRDILKTHPAVHQEFFLVNFDEFNSFSLDIFVHYFTVSTKWAEFLEAKQDINLKIMYLAEKVGVSFAFPSQTLYWGPNQNPKTLGRTQ